MGHTDFSGFTNTYTTFEPCPMCCGAILASGGPRWCWVHPSSSTLVRGVSAPSRHEFASQPTLQSSRTKALMEQSRSIPYG